MEVHNLPHLDIGRTLIEVVSRIEYREKRFEMVAD